MNPTKNWSDFKCCGKVSSSCSAFGPIFCYCYKSDDKSWMSLWLWQTDHIHGHLWHIHFVTTLKVLMPVFINCKRLFMKGTYKTEIYSIIACLSVADQNQALSMLCGGNSTTKVLNHINRNYSMIVCIRWQFINTYSVSDSPRAYVAILTTNIQQRGHHVSPQHVQIHFRSSASSAR